MTSAADLVAQARVVLLDFDGPICSVFSCYPPVRAVSATLQALESAGFSIRPEWLNLEDPHRLLIAAARIPDAVEVVEDALTRAETQAVATAQITGGVRDLIDQITSRGQRWAVVSNNSAESINRFCDREDFARSPSLIVGRAKGEPHLMKPDPFPLTRALQIIQTPASDTVFVGDSVFDVEAGKAADIPTVGYANRPSKVELLKAAMPSALITSMDDLLR